MSKHSNSIDKYQFHKTKYGDELLIDVVRLRDIKKYLSGNALHSLTYFDITLITEGEGLFRIGDHSLEVKKGDVLFTQPGQPREWDIRGITDGYALIFEEPFLSCFFNDPQFLSNISYFGRTGRNPDRLELRDDEYRHLLALIGEVDTEIRMYREKDRHILRAILYQILKYLDRIYMREFGSDCLNTKNEHIDKFIRLVDSSYRQHHSVQYYADKLCLSPNYLSELVRKETGIIAKEFINGKLLTEAKRLLLYSQTPVTEIAVSLNFENPSYFVRFFRKHTGITPLQYRNKDKP